MNGVYESTTPATAHWTGAQREEMIIKFAPLVRYVVGRLAIVMPQVFDQEDLIGYGTIGLIEAVDRYDPGRGVGFESFASDRIRGSVIDALRATDWVPRTSRKRAKDIQKTFVVLEEALGRAPTDDEIATELGLTVVQMRRAMSDAVCSVVSLHRPVRSGDDEESSATLMDTVSDGALGPSQGLEEREIHQNIMVALGRLDDREKRVLSLYYERSLTLREISEVMAISESRVWQLHARAILRVRAYAGLNDGDELSA